MGIRDSIQYFEHLLGSVHKVSKQFEWETGAAGLKSVAELLRASQTVLSLVFINSEALEGGISPDYNCWRLSG